MTLGVLCVSAGVDRYVSNERSGRKSLFIHCKLVLLQMFELI